jgi:predicted DNA-binding protein
LLLELCSGIASFCLFNILVPCIYDVCLLSHAMRRVTFSLEDADHLALKLLAIHERKAMVEVVQEAIKSYLEDKEAYLLAVTKREGS